MKSLLLTLVLSFSFTIASAALLLPQGTGPTVEKVSLGSSATTSVEGQDISLTSVGAGLRAKKVVFVNVKVYVGQLLVESLEKFKKSESEALASLKDQKAVAVRMHFLRDVDAENVRKSFREALQANGVNPDDSSVKQFLEAVSKGGEAKEGKTLTVLGAKLADGSEQVSYENTSGEVSHVKGTAGFIEKIFAIWLGKPSDAGVAELKKSILK